MARGKKHTAEQMVNLLRQVEVGVANGKSMSQACEEAEIVEQTYYRWRKEYGGLRVDQARWLKELEQENSKLKRLVSELSLEKLVFCPINKLNKYQICDMVEHVDGTASAGYGIDSGGAAAVGRFSRFAQFASCPGCSCPAGVMGR
ncbi:MAG: transposase family protein [Edaphobacter sp.]|nr:transposase family protein [Edaphobacter sp.]